MAAELSTVPPMPPSLALETASLLVRPCAPGGFRLQLPQVVN